MVKKGSDGLNKAETSLELLSELNERFVRSRDYRVTQEAQWYKNMAFYMGKQWVDYLLRQER